MPYLIDADQFELVDDGNDVDYDEDVGHGRTHEVPDVGGTSSISV